MYTLARYRGMALAPRALRAAGVIESLGKSARDEGDARLPPLKRDVSTDGVKNLGNFKIATAEVFTKVSGLKSADRVVCVGGECSFVIGSLAGLSRLYAGRPGMLWMDTHGDFNTPATSPSGYIGGMCLAMATGRGPELGEEIEQKRPLIAEERLVHLGARALDPAEEKSMKSSPMELVSMKKIRKEGPRRIAARVSRHLADRADWLVCHLDVDVIDSSLMPAVNYPTAGGLTVEEAASFILALDASEKLKVIDIAAYNPSLDRDGSSARTITGLFSGLFSRN
jgi:arginase